MADLDREQQSEINFPLECTLQKPLGIISDLNIDSLL